MSSVASLDNLPLTLVVELTKMLDSFGDLHCMLVSSEDLNKLRKKVFNLQQILKVYSRLEGSALESSIRYFGNLTHLDLGPWATQAILRKLTTTRLKSLSMVGSLQKIDISILWNQKYLEYLDVTFCDKISYESTVVLRQFLPNLIVRRVPVYGRFVGRSEHPHRFTPYNLWSDGTISHEHEILSIGFVDIARQWSSDDPNHFYMTYEFPDSFADLPSPLNRFFYLAGSVRLVDEETVLAAQYTHGRLFPPQQYPKPNDAEDLEVGEEVFYDRTGQLVYRGHQDSHVMVTKVGRLPIKEGDRPPSEILRRNLEHCRRKRDYLHGTLMEVSKLEAFRSLHSVLGGSDEDAIDIYTSRYRQNNMMVD